MICEKSSFFKAACSKDWLENQEKTVRLPEQEVEIFRMYLECVYKDDIDFVLLSGIPITLLNNIRTVQPEHKSCFKITFVSLCKLWTAADYLGDAKTQNEIIDNIVRIVSGTRNVTVPGRALKFISSNATLQSGLHCWMIEYVARSASTSNMKRVIRLLSSESLEQLLLRLVVNNVPVPRSGLPKPAESVEYHV